MLITLLVLVALFFLARALMLRYGSESELSNAVAAAVVVIAVAGFLLGCIYTEHWMLGIGFGKTVNAFYHGMDDHFRF